MAVSNSPSDSRPRSKWPAIAIVAMAVLFVSVVAERHTLLAYWWAHQLTQTQSLADRAYYVACLTSVGDDGAGAINRLAGDERAEQRALAIPASQGLSLQYRIRLLHWRLSDQDFDIRLNAATALSFMNADVATNDLIVMTRSEDPGAASAVVAGLARVEKPAAIDALCVAAAIHTSPWVRAQAIESLGQQLSSGNPQATTLASTEGSPTFGPLETFVNALSDQGIFSERLALESQIEAATRAVMATKGIPAQTSTTRPTANQRTVSQIAANVLSSLTGQSIQPRAQMTGEEKKSLLKQCQTWMGERRPN